tara:strand:+ start:45 stop:251 length:207 start_codon:yes stop_codon:yes gene_type:complete
VAKPKIIYKGKTPKLSGNNNEDWNVIEMATMSNIYLAPLRSPGFLIKRLLLGKWVRKINRTSLNLLKN